MNGGQNQDELSKAASSLVTHISTLTKLKTAVLSPFKDDQVQFRLSIALKLMALPCITLAIAFGFFWSFLKMDLYFFEAYKLSEVTNFQETYYDYILSTVVGLTPLLLSFVAGTLLLGLYISNMVLRPFRTIGQYCEDVVEGRVASYDPEFFSELRLLTRFTDYFFGIVQTMTKNGKLDEVEVPTKYTRIHQPVFEKSFFIQFSLFVLITSIATGIAVFAATVDIHGQILSLAEKTIQVSPAIRQFLERQESTLFEIMIGVMVAHMILHISFCFHLYNKVAAPAFGIFATFRGFLKGNYGARIHLIGYYYLRPECRKINRYLTWLQKKYT
tara:strand:+ start:2876 stop:3865 length:990 start_codon:yes stop_codon:yes gene_type:complete